MTGVIDWIKSRIREGRMREQAAEREKVARLEAAERQVKDLQERGERAMAILTARDRRNHWQEALTDLIQGVS